MDIQLARTFLEIVNTGSFVRAAERLNVTQTTVSARVRTLESQLGRTLFVRNKAGASLTPAGQQFLRYAPTVVQVWQRACHQVALPAGRRALLAMGGEVSLWNPLLLNWLIKIKSIAPEFALRIGVGIPDELMRQVAAGVLDIAIMYRPQNLPGLRIEQLLKEKLVLVTTGDPAKLSETEYVYVDWGSTFSARHDMSFPNLCSPGVHVDLGPLGLGYILRTGGSGYFRMRTARPYLNSGQLRLVPGAPEFFYPVYAVYPVDGDGDLLRPAIEALRDVSAVESDEWPIGIGPHPADAAVGANDSTGAGRAPTIRSASARAARRPVRKRR